MIKGLRKILSVFMVITVLLSVVSCNARGIKPFQENISSQEMIRLLVSSINDKNITAESYSSIPEVQREDITYSYFSEYLSIIRDISNRNGNVKSFRLLTQEEIVDYCGYLYNDKYGSLVGAELIYANDTDDSMCIFVSEDASGKAFLSLDWIKDTISIYRYSEYYFSMMDQSNYDGLYTLLRPGLSDLYTDTAVYSRVLALVDFYNINVRSAMRDYKICKIHPNNLKVEIPEVYFDDSGVFSNHFVEVVSVSNESYAIKDEIPFSPDVSLLSLYEESSEVVRCGRSYSSEEIMLLLGNPTNISGHELSDEEVEIFGDDYTNKVIMNYSGVLLLFRVNYTSEEGDWEGVLQTIKVLADNDYTVGSDLRVGMSKSELFEIFPYIENTDFVLGYNINGTTYEIVLTFDDDDILSIIRASVV